MPNIFPKSANSVPLKVIIGLVLIKTAVIALITYYFTPSYSNVGYAPVQPVPFEHSLHVEQLNIDCRYCHTYVDRSEHSTVPDTATCLNCHNQIKTDSPLLAPVRESGKTGEPIPWVRIHKTPDYVYFNHSVHVARGISCVHCHGNVNEMDIVAQNKSLHMGFCLECHREPEKYIRNPKDVYDLNWEAETPQQQLEQGERYVHNWEVLPPESCSGCHR